MNIFEALILGIVQGITEFLPISSSGHLVIINKIMSMIGISESGGDANLAFNVLLHVATLISVCFIYKEDVYMLIKEFFGIIGDLFRGKRQIRKTPSPYRRLVSLLILATIPAIIVGGIVKLFNLDPLLENLVIIGIALFVTSFLMYITDKIVEGHYTMENLPVKNAFIVGVAQAIAITPGLSRSGTTLAAATFMGFKREFAVKFAFLMSIPAILGAAVIEGASLLKDGVGNLELLPTIIGFIASAIVGVLAIKFLIALLSKKRLFVFSIYCAFAGVVAIVLSFIK